MIVPTDWISPLIYHMRRGEPMELTRAQMDALKADGYQVKELGAFGIGGGKYLVKVEPPTRPARQVRGLGSARWKCKHCGSKNKESSLHCTQCGAPQP